MSGTLWILARVMLARINVIRAACLGLAVLPVIFLCGQSALAQQTDAERIAALEQRLQTLQDDIAAIRSGRGPRQPSKIVSGPQSPVQNAESACDPGYYVVGVRSWGAPGSTRYCIGCMTGLVVICQRLGGP